VLVGHARLQPGVSHRNRGGRHGLGWICLLSGCGDLPEAGPVAGDGPGGVLGEVVPQMPAISDLGRAGGAVADAALTAKTASDSPTGSWTGRRPKIGASDLEADE